MFDIRLRKLAPVAGLMGVLSWVIVCHAQWFMPFHQWKFTELLRKNNVRGVKTILDQEKDVNLRKDEGTTFLHAAAYWGKVDVCKLLLERGARLDVVDDHGRNAIHYAVIFNGCEMEQKIDTELLRGKKDVCQLLLKNGSIVNTRDTEGNTPLLWAVHPHAAAPDEDVVKDICKLLIAHGADIRVSNTNNRTALHCAAECGWPSICKLLTSKGADVNAQDKDGATPLHLGAAEGNVKVCQMLAKGGVEIDAKDREGQTALATAFMARKDQVVEFLQKYHAKRAAKRHETAPVGRGPGADKR